MFFIKCAVNKIEEILESSPYICLMLPLKENAVHYEYAYLHMLSGKKFSSQKKSSSILN